MPAPDITGKEVTLLIEDSPGAGTYTTIGAATEHGIDISTSEVEFNTKDSGGFRDLFPEGSILSITISGSFQFTSSADQDQVKTLVMSGTPTASFKFRDGSGDEFTGDFQITNWSLSGATEGFASFDITLASDGVVTLAVIP